MEAAIAATGSNPGERSRANTPSVSSEGGRETPPIIRRGHSNLGSGGNGAAATAGGAHVHHAGRGGSACGTSPSSEDSRFECNICLDQVNEPVVTLCGHLFCWPCLYRWLNSNHNMCPVCKAGVTKDNVIPLYGRGTEPVDPRTKPQNHNNDDVPTRPAAQRPEARPQVAGVPGFVGGIPLGNAFGSTHYANGMSFSAGFGFFPSLFGLQFQSFTPTPPAHVGQTSGGSGVMSADEAQQAFLSRLLLMLGIFTLGILVFC